MSQRQPIAIWFVHDERYRYKTRVAARTVGGAVAQARRRFSQHTRHYTQPRTLCDGSWLGISVELDTTSTLLLQARERRKHVPAGAAEACRVVSRR